MFLYNKLCKPFSNKSTAVMLSIGLLGSTLNAGSMPALAAPVTYNEYIYHIHSGDSDSGGGCYTVPVLHEHADECYRTYECKWELRNYYNRWDEINDYTLVFVSDCGETHEQQGALGDRCALSDHVSHTDLICSHTGEIDHYDLGCGLDPSVFVGSFAAVTDTDNWAKSVTMFMAHSGLVNVDSASAYSVNGNPVDGNYINITSNGEYTVHLNHDSSSRVSDITVPISNIDCTAPVITCTPDTTEWTTDNIIVTTTASDLQPDGSNGCGQISYSYNGGSSWTESSVREYDKNGEYTIMVRDMLENTSQTTFNIRNIDREAPTVSISYDDTPNVSSVMVSVDASDTMSDGSEGCGLPDQAYSYDNGNSWTNENTYIASENGLLEIRVRDNLGNQIKESIFIANIDDTAPEYETRISPEGWTNQPVTVEIIANDINPDGSEGSGIPTEGYSYDGGVTWTDEASKVVSDNTNLEIAVRDNAGNINTSECTIETIDTEAPSVALCYALSGNSTEACLKVVASDSGSGLTDTPYKWNASDYSASDTLTVNENRLYTVSVRDKAGNIAVKGIEVEGIVKPIANRPVLDPLPMDEPEEEISNTDPAPEPAPADIPETNPVQPPADNPDDIPQPVSDNPEVLPAPKITPQPMVSSPSGPAAPATTPDTDEEYALPQITPVVINKTIEDEPVAAPKVMDTSDLPAKEANSSSDIFYILGLIFLLLLLAALIIGLLFALSRAILIYCNLGNKKEKFVGLTFAKKSKDAFAANISQSVINSCDTTLLNLKFTMAFIYLHSEEDVTVYLPDKQSFIVKPDTSVAISFKNT